MPIVPATISTDPQHAAVECECSVCECGSELRQLVFGIPDSRDVEAGLLDDVVLGGCMVRGGGSDPDLACPACDRRYVWFFGHLFAEESWLAPIEAVLSPQGELQIILRGRDGHAVSLHLSSEDQVFVHCSNYCVE